MDNKASGPKFNFKTKDIGIKTAVKHRQFAKIRIKKPEFSDHLAKIKLFFKQLPANFQSLLSRLLDYAKKQLRDPKRRFIFIAKIISAAVILIALIIFIVIQVIPKPPAKLESLSDIDIIARLDSSLSEGGNRSESNQIMDAIIAKIKQYHNAGNYFSALELTKKAEPILEKHSLEDVILELFNAFDLKYFDKKQQIEILEYFAETTKKLGNQIINDEINQLLIEVKKQP